MNVYALILENKEIIKILYGAIIALICLVIVLRTDKLFKISLHQGIRYFRNAFFFFGIGFFIKYIVESILIISNYSNKTFFLSSLTFTFFIIMAGFFILYSLIWKKLENTQRPKQDSSLLNLRIILFYFLALILAVIDVIWQTHLVLFLSQIIIFIIATTISFINFSENPSKKFRKFYFIAMTLTLITWIINAFLSLYFSWNKVIMTNIFILNIIIFTIFLYGVIKFTK